MQVTVLEHKRGDFKDDNGNNVTYSNALVQFGGRELKLKTEVILDRHIGKEVICKVSVVPGTGQKPTLTITGVEE